MISLEQWRAAIGGWSAGKLSAIYRRYGSRRIVRNWAKLLLVMDSYTAVIYYALYWLIAGLFAFMSSDGWIIALSVVFDDACGYPHARYTSCVARVSYRHGVPHQPRLSATLLGVRESHSRSIAQKLYDPSTAFVEVGKPLRLLDAATAACAQLAVDRRRRRGAQPGTGTAR